MIAIGAFIKGLALWQQIAATLAVLLIVGGTYVAWRSSIYNEGWNSAIEAIARKDKEAVDAADKAAARVDACWNGGGVWAQGSCKR
jgi:hypothetical protein